MPLFPGNATTTLPGLITLAGDIGGTYALPTVVSLTGSSGTILISSSGNIFTWDKATTAPGLTQAIPTTDVAPANLTISAQSAELAASTHVTGASLILAPGAPATTNGISGNVTVTLFAPTASATTEAAFQVKRGSKVISSIQAIVGAASTDAGLYILPTGAAPTASNYTIDVSGTTEVIYGDNNTGIMLLANKNTTAVSLNTTGATNLATLSSGYNFGIQGMALASYGGGVGVIGIPNATTAPTGAITGSVLYTDPGSSNLSIVPNGNTTPVISFGVNNINLFGVNIVWSNASVTPEILQSSLASTSAGSGANGSNMSIIAQAGQAATGASNNGGNGANLILKGGALGTSGSATAGVPGAVQIGTSFILPSVTKTTTYAMTMNDYHILCNNTSGFTLTLPAPINGLTFEIWDIKGTMETNNVTLAQNASEKISGLAASRILSTNWGHWTIVSNGTDWFIN